MNSYSPAFSHVKHRFFLSAVIIVLMVFSVAVCAAISQDAFAAQPLTTDGSSAKYSGWTNLNGKWYYYKSDGKPAKGFLKAPWRYKDRDGKWQTNPDYKNWYYFDNSGVLKTGWVKDAGKWYYLDTTNGSMLSNTSSKIGNKIYVFSKSGSLVTKKGWVKLSYTQNDPSWFYIKNASGHAQVGWKKISGKWYYFSEYGGYMYSGGGRSVGKNSYLFANSGALVTKTGWQKIKHSWGSTSWYYVKNSSGKLQTGWKKISGKWYYFSPYSGSMYSDQFLTEGWDKYYLNANGSMKTGWLKKNGKWYYFKSDGRMAKGDEYVNGKWYYFCPGDGHLLR